VAHPETVNIRLIGNTWGPPNKGIETKEKTISEKLGTSRQSEEERRALDIGGDYYATQGQPSSPAAEWKGTKAREVAGFYDE